jgi:glycosyltransferase involved in cell wall biosynthesis
VIQASPRLLFLITEDWYFWSHRLDVARVARDSGFDVAIATRVQEHGDRIRHEGFDLYPITLSRRGRNPLRECAAILDLIRLYRRVRPTLVHHVALKPILYGSVAAWLTGVPSVLNAFAGLGYAFTDGVGRTSLLRRALSIALGVAIKLSRSLVVFQNQEDRDLLHRLGVVSEDKTRVIPGSGVDTDLFKPQNDEGGKPIVLLASRMLWDKGIGDFVEAARQLTDRGVVAKFVMVGRCDEDNPAAISRAQLQRWVDEGVIAWWDHRDDMPVLLASAAVVTLPSYREGLPKVLLEAAACGKPMVAADVPGCREVVRHHVTGLLVPPKDPAALAEAIGFLLDHPAQRAAMGIAAREVAVQEYSVPKVAGHMLDLYRELLGHRRDGRPSHRNA